MKVYIPPGYRQQTHATGVSPIMWETYRLAGGLFSQIAFTFGFSSLVLFGILLALEADMVRLGVNPGAT